MTTTKTTGATPNAPEHHPLAAFDYAAGRPCLDFANTLRGRRDEHQREFLPDYAALLAFIRTSGLLDDATADDLAQQLQVHPAAADDVLTRAVYLRETLYRLYSATAAGTPPSATDIAAFDAVLHEALAHRHLADAGAGLHWVYPKPAHLAEPLWALAHDAADLLMGDQRSRLRECAADDCGWVFLDTSRNGSRRWCSMTSCGNRAKVQEFRKRQRAASAG